MVECRSGLLERELLDRSLELVLTRGSRKKEMSQPESAEHGVAFDLGAIEREMRQEGAYERNGHTARTLLRAPDLRVLLIVIKGGSRIAEHQAIASASIHALSGQLRLRLPDRTVELRAGQLVVLGGGLRHDVEAAIDSTFVLTLGWHDEH
jgi:quercetin dioxygenase-like cupin family protein